MTNCIFVWNKFDLFDISVFSFLMSFVVWLQIYIYFHNLRKWSEKLSFHCRILNWLTFPKMTYYIICNTSNVTSSSGISYSRSHLINLVFCPFVCLFAFCCCCLLSIALYVLIWFTAAMVSSYRAKVFLFWNLYYINSSEIRQVWRFCSHICWF
jgi:hypothetical protein